MNKVDILKNALSAVNYQQTGASMQLRAAKEIKDGQNIKFWESQIAEHEATYQGLLKMLFELNEQGGAL